MTEREYLFDVKLMATIRLNAASEKDARAMLAAEIDCSSANLGAWPNGDPLLAEVSMDGEADLVEVDGDDPITFRE